MASSVSSLGLPRRWPAALKAAIVHTVSLAMLVLVRVRGDCVNSRIARVRMRGEVDQLRTEVALLREEIRIKDARMDRIEAARRPHYSPSDRLAILTLRSARGWNLAQTARAFLVTDATIVSWTQRLAEHGESALVRTAEPVTKYPDFVRAVVQKLKALAPVMGRRKIAETLARAGLHLGASTVRRLLAREKKPPPENGDGPAPEKSTPPKKKPHRVVTAKRPDHVWHVDLTVVPTLAGFWIPWLCQALPASWPFGWRVLVVLDHFSRGVVGFQVFRSAPSAANVVRALERMVKQGRGPPKHVVSDRGVQFREDYLAWCKRRGVRPRFGAIGQHGSIAVIERFFRTLKTEGLRRALVPLGIDAMRDEIGAFVRWYEEHRPHAALGGRTPAEVRNRRRPRCTRLRFEPRSRMPKRRAIRGKPGDTLELDVAWLEARRHLPVVSVRRQNAQ